MADISSRQSTAPTNREQKDDPAANRFSRGQKLVLKDGNFQLVRSYERNGERVRYFSVERNDWEEIPAAMVDWGPPKRRASKKRKPKRPW